MTVPERGKRYYSEQFESEIRVTRLARDRSWADIHVMMVNGGWRKRQPLRNGEFPFEVVAVET